jgi:hypothetical protein
MLRVVTLALMAIGATAAETGLDSMKKAGCVDQSAAFINKLADPDGSLTDCDQVAGITKGNAGSCTGVDGTPSGSEQTKAQAFHLARACPAACDLPCLDSPAPLAGVAGVEAPATSWTCKQYADYLGITNGDCSVDKIDRDKDPNTDLSFVWRMCPNQCGAPCVGSSCPPAPTTATTSAATRAAELKGGVIGLLAVVGGWIAILDQ